MSSSTNKKSFLLKIFLVLSFLNNINTLFAKSTFYWKKDHFGLKSSLVCYENKSYLKKVKEKILKTKSSIREEDQKIDQIKNCIEKDTEVSDILIEKLPAGEKEKKRFKIQCLYKSKKLSVPIPPEFVIFDCLDILEYTDKKKIINIVNQLTSKIKEYSYEDGRNEVKIAKEDLLKKEKHCQDHIAYLGQVVLFDNIDFLIGILDRLKKKDPIPAKKKLQNTSTQDIALQDKLLKQLEKLAKLFPELRQREFINHFKRHLDLSSTTNPPFEKINFSKIGIYKDQRSNIFYLQKKWSSENESKNNTKLIEGGRVSGGVKYASLLFPLTHLDNKIILTPKASSSSDYLEKAYQNLEKFPPQLGSFSSTEQNYFVLPEKNMLSLAPTKNQDFFIVNEWFQDGNINSAKDRIGELSIKAKLILVRKMLKSVKILHDKGLLHKDIKPDNFLVDLENKHDPRIQLTDFDMLTPIEKYLPDRDGTSGYISPLTIKFSLKSSKSLKKSDFVEQRKLIGRHNDLFALGTTILELFSIKGNHDIKKSVAPPWKVASRELYDNSNPRNSGGMNVALHKALLQKLTNQEILAKQILAYKLNIEDDHKAVEDLIKNTGYNLIANTMPISHYIDIPKLLDIIIEKVDSFISNL